ncbi:MAG: hypothetical protein HOF02_06400 [Gammaproteobacteria bacterium]|jgi:hypothetical protein|nr:hypothetical protein [Gammaproteobacteria bacterium]
MFGFGLKSKTENVLLDHFNYPVSDMKRHIFNALVKEGKSMGQNEYSIAIFYMMMNMNILAKPDEEMDIEYKRTDSEQKEINDFIDRNGKIIGQIMHLANSPETDIREMLKEIVKKSGMAKPDNRPVDDSDIENKSESDEADSDETESDKDMDALMRVSDFYKQMVTVGMTLVPKPKEISEYQHKFMLSLQLMGCIDFIAQSNNIDQAPVMAALVIRLTDDLDELPLFGWNQKQAASVFHQLLEIESEPWAIQILISGAKAFEEMFPSEEDSETKRPLAWADIFEDEEILKQVAANVSAAL